MTTTTTECSDEQIILELAHDIERGAVVPMTWAACEEDRITLYGQCCWCLVAERCCGVVSDGTMTFVRAAERHGEPDDSPARLKRIAAALRAAVGVSS